MADPSRPYSPPLDGIRAIAILGVLVFHVAPDSLPGGFTGVDVFFALSGYLLGGIVLEDITVGRFSMREFYLRRFQRLLPEMILTVTVVLLLWRLFLPPSAAEAAGWHALWTLGNASNFYIWTHLGGYWGGGADMAPLLHTWSLAVEEQFYLVFPGLMLVLARYAKRGITAWLAGIAAVSLGLCIWWTPRAPDAAFYMLPARLWELLLGAALASLVLRAGGVWREAAGWIGLGAIVAGYWCVGSTGFPGYAALLPIAGALLAIFSASGETKLAALLSTRPLVALGKLSYALYLWHWPLIILGRFEAELHGQTPILGAVLGAAVSVAVSVVAYTVIEQPLRARGPGRSRRVAAIATAFAVCLAAAFVVARFTPPIDTARYFDRPAFYGRLYSAGKVSNELAHAIRFRDVDFPSLAGRTDGDWQRGGVLRLYGGPTPEVVLLGSSHGAMYARLVDEICRDLHLSVSLLAVDGAPVFFSHAPSESFPTGDDCERFNQARRRYLAQWRPRVVLLIERWDSYAADGPEFEAWLIPLLREVAPLTGRMLFVAQPPVIAQIGDNFNLREWAVWRARGAAHPPALFPDENESKRQLSVDGAELAQSDFPNLRVLRPDKAFLEPGGSVRWASGRTVYYADDDHLSQAGAESVRAVFQSALEDATRAERK